MIQGSGIGLDKRLTKLQLGFVVLDILSLGQIIDFELIFMEIVGSCFRTMILI